jgi:hypothetical protein
MDVAYDSGDALTILGFVSLHFHPSSVYYIYATVTEQFGYGFGFVPL